MKVEELVKNRYKARSNCVFPAYEISKIKTVKISKSEIIKVSSIEYDEDDSMVIVMCKVDRVLVRFIITIEQLTSNFVIC